MVAVPISGKTVGSDEEKANANGGVAVSGYLTGVSGVRTTSISTYESKCCGGGTGTLVTRSGGG